MTIKEMQERKKELGLSYERIAEKSGMPLGTVQKVLGGITKSPRYETLAALERVLAKSKEFWAAGAKTSGMSSTDLTENSGTLFPEDVCESSYYNFRPTARRLNELDRQGSYTVEDYLALPDDQRYELIDGVLYGMSAPSIYHQEIAGEIYAQLRYYVRSNKGKCKVLISPVDVQLDMDNHTMVQPDVLILCDQGKIDHGKRIFGAPDFTAEVLSDSTARKDLTIKMYKYKKAGVKEYWIIDPENSCVTVHLLEAGTMTVYTFDRKIPVGIFDGKCEIDLSDML